MTLSVPTPPTSLGFLVLGLSDTQWAGGSLPAQLPLSGCDLLVSPDTSALLTGPAYNYVLQNPQNSSLLGLRIFGQALFAELTTNPPTLSTSAGVAIVIGAR